MANIVEYTKQPTVQEFKDLASCLDRLQKTPDWKKFVEGYLFGTFLNANTENIVEPIQPEMSNPVRISIRNVQNINWFKSVLTSIYESAVDPEAVENK